MIIWTNLACSRSLTLQCSSNPKWVVTYYCIGARDPLRWQSTCMERYERYWCMLVSTNMWSKITYKYLIFQACRIFCNVGIACFATWFHVLFKHRSQSQEPISFTYNAQFRCVYGGVFNLYFKIFMTRWPMSLRHCEWRVCGCGQTTSKPSIHKAPFYGLRNCFGSPKKTSDG